MLISVREQSAASPLQEVQKLRVLKNFYSYFTVIFISVGVNEKIFDLYFKLVIHFLLYFTKVSDYDGLEIL